MTITSQQKRALKGQLHSLKPVVIVGNGGLTEGVLQEIDRALEDHELIKIRLNEQNRDKREAMAAAICKSTKATMIQSIGQIIAIYKKIPKREAE